MEITVPTFVPSLITGTASTVTTFKAPPKNKEAMFDFSLAGPLAGIVASIVALTIGSQLTLTSDPATMPALPLEILRQSTLGGGIIDGIIQGSLYLPDGAPMSGILISLHPVAIAGYIGLMVNALNLVPVGSKYSLSSRKHRQSLVDIRLLTLTVFQKQFSNGRWKSRADAIR
jgi:membrane-associated protease RseP (regulator of RpoE activity)